MIETSFHLSWESSAICTHFHKMIEYVRVTLGRSSDNLKKKPSKSFGKWLEIPVLIISLTRSLRSFVSVTLEDKIHIHAQACNVSSI